MKILNTIITILLLLANSNSYSQIINKTGSIYTEISSIITNLPGDSEADYNDPSAAELDTWDSALTNLLAGNYQMASDSANTIGYDLVNFTDNNFSPAHTYYILEANSTNYWGTYVYYPDFCRSVVIQSPHPKKDANTGHQGIHIFRRTEAMFYCLSGTHRCNSTDPSSCSGTTTTCTGSSAPFRLSDLAHTTSSIFQKTTDLIQSNYSDTYFIQLHGFTKLSTDPYVILSNGTQVTPAVDYFPTFRDKLFEADNVLTFKIAHIDLDWTRLRGFSNTQGRLINSSANACSSSATTSDGRFFHVEQEKLRLRNDSIGWNKLAFAVNNTFTCSTVLPVDLQGFKCTKTEEGVKIDWQTHSEINNDFFIIRHSADNRSWENLTTIEGAGNSNSLINYSFFDKTPLIGENYYQIQQVDFDGESNYSEVCMTYLKNKKGTLKVFPNPAGNELSFHGTSEDLKIYNSIGIDVSSMISVISDDDHMIQLDLSKLIGGIYFIWTHEGIGKINKL